MNEHSKESDMSSILGNMALAHEMIMTDNFQLKTINETEDENSLAKSVHDIVHKAFWDVLETEVTANPPQYTHAVNLLKEMKELILELLGSNENSIHSQVKEAFDMDLISQEIEHETFDILRFAHFVLSILSKVCAPIRDGSITQLKEQTEIVPLLRGIFELINLMKLDMANYEMKSIKPIIMQQAVEYEKAKFAEYLNEHPDNLSLTTSWLKGAFERIKTLQKPDVKITPSVVITNAYLSLVQDEETTLFPETLYMDAERLKNIAITFHQLLNLSTILTFCLNFLGPHFSTDSSFVKHLKNTIMILMDDSTSIDESLLENIYIQLMVESDKESEKKGFEKKSENDRLMFKRQILDVVKTDNHLKVLIKSRIRDHILLTMTSQNQNTLTSTVLQPIENELKEVTVKFLRVISHNRNVFISYYTNIIQNFLNEGEKS